MLQSTLKKSTSTGSQSVSSTVQGTTGSTSTGNQGDEDESGSSGLPADTDPHYLTVDGEPGVQRVGPVISGLLYNNEPMPSFRGNTLMLLQGIVVMIVIGQLGQP